MMSDERVTRLMEAIAAHGIPDLPDQWPTIRARIAQASAPRSLRTSGDWRQRQWGNGRVVASVAVAIAIILALSMGVWQSATRPQPVSAQTILRKVAAGEAAGLGVRTYHLRMEIDTSLHASFESWVALPNRWRTEYRSAANPYIYGTNRVSGSMRDGTTEWSYNPTGISYDVRIGALRTGISPPSLATLPLLAGGQTGQAVGDVGDGRSPGQSPLQGAFFSCYPHATVTGSATIAGREAYVIDLGASVCPPGYTFTLSGTPVPMATEAPAQQGRHIMWVDKALSVVLGHEFRNADGSLQSRSTVTVFAVNQSIPDGVFAFAPPAEVSSAHVVDLRPQPYQLPESATSPTGVFVPGLVYPSLTPQFPTSPTPTP